MIVQPIGSGAKGILSVSWHEEELGEASQGGLKRPNTTSACAFG